MVRKETERLKSEINNEAAEITQNATAKATIIRAKADAEALLIVEKARDVGLSYIYQKLNITKEEHKNAFNYLRTLRGQKNVKFNVGYSTLMARDWMNTNLVFIIAFKKFLWRNCKKFLLRDFNFGYPLSLVDCMLIEKPRKDQVKNAIILHVYGYFKPVSSKVNSLDRKSVV